MSYLNVVGILKESQQLLEANRQLQKQSQQLQRLTDELRQAYGQLQALDQQKDELLYTITHELRTPLTSIRALAEILADNPDLETEERERFQRTISREAERLTRLISLVLDLEKYESGQAQLAPTPSRWPTWCRKPPKPWRSWRASAALRCTSACRRPYPPARRP